MENILSTTDYSKFRVIETNRPVDKNHVKRLKAAITNRNLLRLNPILVDTKMHVIDGQHRLTAAKELGVEIYYMTSGEITQEDIATLNSNKKLWHLIDYVQYHAKNGKVAYSALQLFMKNNHFLPPSVAVVIACGDIKSKDLQAGLLTTLNLDEAESFMGRLSDIRNHFSEVYTAKFVQAMRIIEKVEGYEHKQMMEQITFQPRSLKPCTTSKEYIKNLEEIYNYRKKNRVRFY
jgi:hypothetical protein